MSCVTKIAKAIAQDCAGRVPGFSGRAIVAAFDDVTFTTGSNKPAEVASVTITSNSSYKCEYFGTDPFSGSNKSLVTENGISQYQKVFALRVPDDSAETGEKVIAPLARGRHVVIYEANNGKVFIDGLYGVLKATEQTQNAYENAGDWMVNMQDAEDFPTVELVPASGTAKAAFETLYAAALPVAGA